MDLSYKICFNFDVPRESPLNVQWRFQWQLDEVHCPSSSSFSSFSINLLEPIRNGPWFPLYFTLSPITAVHWSIGGGGEIGGAEAGSLPTIVARTRPSSTDSPLRLHWGRHCPFRLRVVRQIQIFCWHISLRHSVTSACSDNYLSRTHN